MVVDLVDDVAPVRDVRAAGGAFRSPLWRSAVAAALGRPVTFADDAGGSALNAAAVGWFALGRAEYLAERKQPHVLRGESAGANP